MIEQQDYHTPVEDSLQDLCSLSRDLLTREAVTTDTPKSRRSLREWLSEGHLSNVSRQLQLQEEGPEQCTSRGGVVFLQEITGYIQAPPPITVSLHFPTVPPLLFLEDQKKLTCSFKCL